jgi:hypothetical protein
MRLKSVLNDILARGYAQPSSVMRGSQPAVLQGGLEPKRRRQVMMPVGAVQPGNTVIYTTPGGRQGSACLCPGPLSGRAWVSPYCGKSHAA